MSLFGTKKTKITDKGSYIEKKKYDEYGKLTTIKHTEKSSSKSHYHKVGRGILGPFTGSKIKKK
jgi:hypothetical protein